MKKQLLILLFCIPFLYGCPDEGDRLWIVNNSEQSIFVYLSFVRQDTLPLNKTNNLSLLDNRTSHYTNSTVLPIFSEINDSTYLTILSADTVNKYSWDVIVKDMKILKRYAISNKESDLKAINYRVYYPE
ncbi:MAG: hypothetical protein QM660_11460 [Dysgonomonas sp.]